MPAECKTELVWCACSFGVCLACTCYVVSGVAGELGTGTGAEARVCGKRRCCFKERRSDREAEGRQDVKDGWSQVSPKWLTRQDSVWQIHLML